ncbi:hypothetical protein E2C01_051205 [Portunus trituberculatus]|uniref:Uncharacterized protein n=1 Tax=Portunus trituberculatus TaxID=210409 RepID=A0A5B7GJN0_PORTR|nr:hypothetical protein [Portunus trituberculatus]
MKRKIRGKERKEKQRYKQAGKTPRILHSCFKWREERGAGGADRRTDRPGYLITPPPPLAFTAPPWVPIELTKQN